MRRTRSSAARRGRWGRKGGIAGGSATAGTVCHGLYQSCRQESRARARARASALLWPRPITQKCGGIAGYSSQVQLLNTIDSAGCWRSYILASGKLWTHALAPQPPPLAVDGPPRPFAGSEQAATGRRTRPRPPTPSSSRQPSRAPVIRS